MAWIGLQAELTYFSLKGYQRPYTSVKVEYDTALTSGWPVLSATNQFKTPFHSNSPLFCLFFIPMTACELWPYYTV